MLRMSTFLNWCWTSASAGRRPVAFGLSGSRRELGVPSFAIAMVWKVGTAQISDPFSDCAAVPVPLFESLLGRLTRWLLASHHEQQHCSSMTAILIAQKLALASALLSRFAQ